MKYSILFIVVAIAVMMNPVSACVFDDLIINNNNIFKPVIKQEQEQIQIQKQSQSQSNVQVVSMNIPQDMNGIKISTTGQPVSYDVKTLDVMPIKKFSRLVYPDEVLSFPVTEGQVVTIKAASDVAFYTVGRQASDVENLYSSESMPSYDKIYHKMVWGKVLPMQSINYFTSANELTIENGSTFVVIDNRAPMNTYTHVEYTIEG